MEQFQLFQSIVRRNGLSLDEAQEAGLRKYVELLLEWNTKINLISRRDEENVWTAHILHAVSLLFRVRLPDGLRVLDLGTGGGIPGIPLAIMRRTWSVTLMDSITKKMKAVEEMSGRLGLPGCRCVTGRAEDPAMIAREGKAYDLVLARGVASSVHLVTWGFPYLREGKRGEGIGSPGGEEVQLPAVIAYKGGELEELRIRRPQVAATVISLVFPGSDEAGLEEKKLVVYRPLSSTN